METIVISEPIIQNGVQTFEHGKYYRWFSDKRICKFVDHKDGSGYMEWDTRIWEEIDKRPPDFKPFVSTVRC